MLKSFEQISNFMFEKTLTFLKFLNQLLLISIPGFAFSFKMNYLLSSPEKLNSSDKFRI